MNGTTAMEAATQAGDRARKLGLNLSDYDDPDVGQLSVECARLGVALEVVLD